jgi:hypothetical protein
MYVPLFPRFSRSLRTVWLLLGAFDYTATH